MSSNPENHAQQLASNIESNAKQAEAGSEKAGNRLVTEANQLAGHGTTDDHVRALIKGYDKTACEKHLPSIKITDGNHDSINGGHVSASVDIRVQGEQGTVRADSGYSETNVVPKMQPRVTEEPGKVAFNLDHPSSTTPDPFSPGPDTNPIALFNKAEREREMKHEYNTRFPFANSHGTGSS